jgi:FAD/FMN-containing dehydrogenase
VTPRLSELGLAALHGSSSDVGIAGYSLGGGMGWLARRYGLQANSVTAIEIVTAEGHLVRTDATHEPDLFWALRGGGGNFGVVTALEFTVYPVPELYAGALWFPFDRAGDVLRTWHGLLPTLPDEMMSWATLLHFPDDLAVPDELRGGSFAIVMAAFLGSASRGRELLRPLHDLGPATDTFACVPPIALGRSRWRTPPSRSRSRPPTTCSTRCRREPSTTSSQWPVRARGRRRRWSSCGTWAERWRARPPERAPARRCPAR